MPGRKPRDPRELNSLEVDLLECVVSGGEIATVAQRLGYSVSWASTTLERVRHRFNCRTTPQLIAKLFREGLLR